MDRRRNDRKKRRLTCQVHYQEQRFRGIVLDISFTGLFIQTTATIPPRARVVVTFPCRDDAPALEVTARVARRRKVPQRLTSVMAAGIGVRVIDPPEAYDLLVQGQGWEPVPPGEPEVEGESTPALDTFRVRLSRRGSPRTRTLSLQAADEEAARKRTALELSEWEILEIEKT